jgi:hypothetical protein
MADQGKLLTKFNQIYVIGFLRAYLGWSIETYVSKLSNIFLSQNCVQKYLVCNWPKLVCMPFHVKQFWNLCNILYQGWPDLFAEGSNLNFIYYCGPQFFNLLMLFVKFLQS